MAQHRRTRIDQHERGNIEHALENVVVVCVWVGGGKRWWK